MKMHPFQFPETMRKVAGALSFLALSLTVTQVPAAGQVVARAGGIEITDEEMLLEVRTLPPQVQSQVLARPADAAQMAQGLVVRRELARRAETEGLQNDPAVAAALRVARERILADASLARIDAQGPGRAAFEKLARNQFDAAPDRFTTPEQIRVSHILVSPKSCEPEARARDVLARASQPGADFAALAREYSDDPGSAPRGGDLGFFSRGKMAPAFENVAFALKQPGELSGIVKTEFGYHIIRLDERKAASRQSFDAVRDALTKSLVDTEARGRRQQEVDKITSQIQFNEAALEAVIASRPPAPKSN